MSSSSQHAFRVIDDVSLEYATNVNIASRTERPYFILGSNALVLASSPITRRPGFRNNLCSAFTFPANCYIARWFTWRRWGGNNILMVCITGGSFGTAEVWKQEVGVDVNFLHLFTSATNVPFDFVVSNNFVYFSNGTEKRKYDNNIVSEWGFESAPLTAPTLVNGGAGNVPGVIGHQYVYAFGNSSTDAVSDISPLSAKTSAVNSQWQITGARSADPQCDVIHIYRTEDGGGVFYELDSGVSPTANPGTPTWTITDNDFDTTSTSTPRLNGSVQAPLARVNLAPTPAQGWRLYAGRLWGFFDDTVIFSGLEEVNNGIPEECFGTLATNSQRFGSKITGLAVLGSNLSSLDASDPGTLLVFTARAIFYIKGSSLATFRIGTISHSSGCQNLATIVEGEAQNLGPFVSWLDSANQVRLINSGGIQDISFPIRPDLIGIDHLNSSVTIHEDGLYRWLLLADGVADKIRVFDLDRMKWLPPWDIGGLEAIGSGETTPGVRKLLLGRTGKPLSMDYSSFLDFDPLALVDAPYTSYIATSLLSVLSEANPEQVAVIEYVGIERNSANINDITYLLDEDPLAVSSAGYTSILANVADPFLRATVDGILADHKSGVNLVEKWYYLRTKAGARRVSVAVSWPATDSDFKLFSITIAGSRQGDS